MAPGLKESDAHTKFMNQMNEKKLILKDRDQSQSN